MFGVTIFGCFLFRMILQNLNKKLEATEVAVDSEKTTQTELEDLDEALRMRKGFRYLV
ncbi:uncharacterized protein TrAtP1_011909 [Trichoderma atroviride]|nr:hypothetical protein TrAtP1_011909 [Trichoderma atroviride]